MLPHQMYVCVRVCVCVCVCIYIYKLALYGFVYLYVSTLYDSEQDEREAEWHAARLGLEPRAAAARAKPLNVGSPLY